ncbi:hypothetical protein JTE90_026595 [Oedothorax gibbosus]|uniref:Uncharacterized protein n=1 Tax=Oedothorax gibbosus TaxID=931172 RepID=A0AAV6TDU1_9ARAC|nr:hypothetical protein JTE90_026595 [Oedothorax gibbosus]
MLSAVRIHTENHIKRAFCPFALREVFCPSLSSPWTSAYHLTDVPRAPANTHLICSSERIARYKEAARLGARRRDP